LADNFVYGPTTELERVPQISVEKVRSIAEELGGERSGKAVLSLEHGLGGGIEGTLGGEGGAWGKTDQKKADGNDSEGDGN